MLKIEGLDVEKILSCENWVLERNLSCENESIKNTWVVKIEFLNEIWVVKIELWKLSCENEGTYGHFLQHFTAFDKIYPPFDNIRF